VSDKVPRVYDVIAKIAGELGKVGLSKDKTNQQQGFKYRGVDDAMNALNPLLAKHGLLILPRVTKYQCVERVSASGKPLFYTILDVEYDFISSEDGSKHTVGPMIGEAMDSGDKSANKAMAIAYKYVCFQAFCIPTEATVDPDAEVHNVLTPAQALGKRFVTALAVGIDDAVYDVWDTARADPATYKAAWKLLTKDEHAAINACIERAKAGRTETA
jgi:hypothetical protein